MKYHQKCCCCCCICGNSGQTESRCAVCGVICDALEDAVRVITRGLPSGAAVKAPVGIVGGVEAQLLLQHLGLAAHLVENGALLHDRHRFFSWRISPRRMWQRASDVCMCVCSAAPHHCVPWRGCPRCRQTRCTLHVAWRQGW